MAVAAYETNVTVCGTVSAPERGFWGSFFFELETSGAGIEVSRSNPVRVEGIEGIRSRPSLEEIQRLRGKYRDLLSPTEEFLERKRRELEIEERRW